MQNPIVEQSDSDNSSVRQNNAEAQNGAQATQQNHCHQHTEPLQQRALQGLQHGLPGAGAKAHPANAAPIKFWDDEPPVPKLKWETLPLRKYSRPEPYPTHRLPRLICEAIREVEEITQAPEAMIAASALSAVSAAVQAHVSVRRDEGLDGPVSLFFLTVAKSGERKTTCDKLFTAAIRQWEAEEVQKAKPEFAKFRASLSAWESVEAGLKERLKKAARDGREQEAKDNPLIQHELSKPVEPYVRSMIRGDDTPEALAAALGRWPVAAIISSEAGIIFGAHGMNPDSVTRNLSQMNTFWDGGRLKRDRTTTQSVDIEGMRVTVGLQVQAEVLDNFMAKSGVLARGIGYLARFLFSQPESTQGTRYYREPKPGSPALEAFNARVKDLLAIPANIDNENKLMTTYLALSPEAKNVWVNFHDEIEEQLGIGQELHLVQDIASKAADNAARLACCFEVFSEFGGSISEVSAVNMAAAASAMRWYLAEALRFCKQTAIPEGLRQAEMLEKWLAEYSREKNMILINAKLILQLAPEQLRNQKARDDALEILLAHDRVKVFVIGRTKEILLNPEVAKEWY
jgi:hypothetical protein